MQSENLVPCAHERCRCLVEVEDQFCSPALQRRASHSRIAHVAIPSVSRLKRQWMAAANMRCRPNVRLPDAVASHSD